MAGLFQGDPLPAITKTTEAQQAAPEFYTNYLQDIANLGQNAVQQGGIAGFSPLQQQAFQMAPDVAFAGAGSMGAGSQLLGEAGATTVPDVIADYMNPYTSSVVDEMGRLTNRNVQENILPNLGAAAIGSGQYGSRRQAQVTGNALRDIQSDLLGKQMQALQTGYTNAGTQAQTDLSRTLQAGQAFGNLGAQQQGLGLGGLNTLSSFGGQQQAQGQKLLDYPMAQTQQFAKLLQGYQVPMGTTTQSTGSEGYSNSPLSQIAGLGTLMAALFPAPVAKKAHGGVMHKAEGGLSIASQDDFQKQWDATKAEGYKGDAVADRKALANALSDYQTNQNLGNMYGVTSAPDQKIFLDDYKAAQGSNNQAMNEGSFLNQLVAENTANKGAGNKIMDSFAGTTANPFLGQYTSNNANTGAVSDSSTARINPYTQAQLQAQAPKRSSGIYDPMSDPKQRALLLAQENQDNQYSGYPDANNTSPSALLNANNNVLSNQINTTFDKAGNRRIQTPTGTYTYDKTGKFLGFNLNPEDTRSQFYQTGKMANGGGVRLADGGMAPAGAEYTDGKGNYYDADGYLLG